ncbi:hypothetical protein L1987_75043 [Smallanthus sonchifolius]|uniref:Uncharacterized protein n=1 Tax=Smallanthus sonchifolius TaxID=185202 RepID=A0ACB9A593_9ASTR|nr:hypothetical protein L1987_75043 [Smallanthus sonchifolius]
MREGNQRVCLAKGHHTHNHNPMTQLQAKYKNLKTGFKDWIAIVTTNAVKGAVKGAVMGAFIGYITKDLPSSSQHARVFSGGSLIQARNFAVWSGVDAGLYCVMKGLRGKDDVQSSMVAGFGSGAAFSLVSGMRGPVSTGVIFALVYGGIWKLQEKFSKPRAEDVLYNKTRGMLWRLGLHDYEKNFKSGLLTDSTLPLLTDSALREVKIPPGPRLLILDHIRREAELNRRKGGRSTSRNGYWEFGGLEDHIFFFFPSHLSNKGMISSVLWTAFSTSFSNGIILTSSLRFKFKPTAFLKPQSKTPVVENTLRVLQWDQLSDSVASFSGTSLGRQATKAELWCLDRSYQESLRLLAETNAAVEMHNHGGCVMDFTSIDMELVKSAIQHAHRGFPVDGVEAMAIVAMLQLVDSLQINLREAIKEDSDWLRRFMPVAEMIMDMTVNRPLVKFIQKLVDEDGCVKDSASPTLKRSREQVRLLERKLYQLMDSLISNEMKETSSMEVSNIDGRWCIKSGTDTKKSFDGLLLSSGSGTGSLVEPLSAVPLNDELQQARASVSKAEADVLLEITRKMQTDLEDIENLFNTIIQLDVINARATYSISFGGTCPDLIFSSEESPLVEQGKWKLYMPKAYHPLLLQQHRQNMQKAMKDVSDATAEIRRRRQQVGIVSQREEETYANLSSLEAQVARLKQSSPVPVDIYVAKETRVLVITGPNTGGKTILLKTVGLAAMMAKSGIFVLSSEPVKMPWFDSVFADIGDEQSLSQSLSTFSGHLKQTSDILSRSTSRSLVLLDEVGAGTNPLEGAALGMSLLECFAEAGVGASLTMATTHHGELKTLKYSNNVFDNACMEFDEVNLKPTYRILWGIPGRSNAINIAERLGLPNVVVDNARELHGTSSAEINEVIEDMEKLKQKVEEHIHEARHHLRLGRELHKKLVISEGRIREDGISQRYRKIQEISEAGGVARSILHKKVRQRRASPTPNLAASKPENDNTRIISISSSQSTTVTEKDKTTVILNDKQQPLEKLVKAGDTVHVSKFNKKASVLKVDPSKQEVLVQFGNIKLKLALADIQL